MNNSGRKTIEYLLSEVYFATTLLQKSDSQMPFLSLYITEYQIFALEIDFEAEYMILGMNSINFLS